MLTTILARAAHVAAAIASAALLTAYVTVPPVPAQAELHASFPRGPSLNVRNRTRGPSGVRCRTIRRAAPRIAGCRGGLSAGDRDWHDRCEDRTVEGKDA